LDLDILRNHPLLFQCGRSIKRRFPRLQETRLFPRIISQIANVPIKPKHKNKAEGDWGYVVPFVNEVVHRGGKLDSVSELRMDFFGSFKPTMGLN
jgi:hypothetical protein